MGPVDNVGGLSQPQTILGAMAISSRPVKLQGKIFRGSSVVRRGLLTWGNLRTNDWQQLFRDIYADSTLTITHRLRCVAVSKYMLPDGAVIAGRSAAHILGISPFDLAEPVEVVSPKIFGPVNGVTVHKGTVSPAEVVSVNGLRVTSPMRTCSDLAGWLSEAEAVVFLDMVAAKRLVTAEQLREYAELRFGRRGSDQLRRAAALMDPGSESPQESRLRVGLVRARLPRFIVQHVVRHENKFVARTDLALPELQIAVEYDGNWHATQDQLERDRKRLNSLVGAGWKVIHVTAGRMRDDFAGIVSEVQTAIREQRRRTR
jgi:very-short-patch-repair endonuclease